MKALIAALALVGAGVGQAHAEDWVCTLVEKGKKPTSISGPVYLWVQSATSVYAIDPPLFTIFKKPQPVQVKKNTSSVLRITWNIESGEDTKGKTIIVAARAESASGPAFRRCKIRQKLVCRA